jgi:hypothetical protein
MSLVLDGVVPPPHLLQSRSASWPCPYNLHAYPAPGSSPTPMSPQSLHSYMSHMPESPLPSQESNHLPTSGWYGPSVSAPDCHHEVSTSDTHKNHLLTHHFVDWLRPIQAICASTYVFHGPIITCFNLPVCGKRTNIDYASRCISKCPLSHFRSCPRDCIARVIAPIRRISSESKPGDRAATSPLETKSPYDGPSIEQLKQPALRSSRRTMDDEFRRNTHAPLGAHSLLLYISRNPPQPSSQ